MKSIYEKIGVPRNITHEELRKEYKLFCKRYHPDKGGNAEQFTEAKELYAVLLDKERRQKYDETGETKVVNEKAMILGKVMLYMQECVSSGDSPNDYFMGKKQSIMQNIAHKQNTIIDTKKHLVNFLKKTTFLDDNSPVKIWMETEISKASGLKEKLNKERYFENKVFQYIDDNMEFQDTKSKIFSNNYGTY